MQTELSAPEAISTVEQITPGWMQGVLQHANVDAGSISRLDIEPIGHGTLSNTVRVNIYYDSEVADDKITSVICKLLPENEHIIALAQQLDVYRREVEVYKLFGNSPPLNVPRAYFAAAGEMQAELTLILENLSSRAILGDQVAGCSPSEAKAVINEFAKLHSAYWDIDLSDKQDWLFRRDDKAEAMAESYHSGAQIMRERYSGRIAPDHLELMEAFSSKVLSWTREHTPPRTLIHGEARVDNILFEETLNDATHSLKAWLIDWQFTDAGSPMFDTAYFLAGSLTTADRESCERALVQHHQSVIAELDDTYSYEIAINEYMNALPFALFTTVGAANAVPENDAGDRLLIALIKRNIAALQYWNVVP